MIKKSGISVFLLICLFSSYAQEKQVDIKIIQDKKTFSMTDPVITLNKKPFVIQVTLTNMDGVYLYADFSDSIYRLANTDPIPDFDNLASMAMAEESFNKDQELIISKTGWAYWFYDKNLDWHRFDKDIKMLHENSMTGKKTIRQFYFPETEQTIKIAAVTLPLYLFFVTVEKDAAGNAVKELQRQKATIHWK
jgi:hypothetical protein